MSTGAKRAMAKRVGPNSIRKQIPQDAHGLWIDRELLRRHMNPVPKFVRSDEPVDRQNASRYLELADTLLGMKDQHEKTH